MRPACDALRASGRAAVSAPSSRLPVLVRSGHDSALSWLETATAIGQNRPRSAHHYEPGARAQAEPRRSPISGRARRGAESGDCIDRRAATAAGRDWRTAKLHVPRPVCPASVIPRVQWHSASGRPGRSRPCASRRSVSLKNTRAQDLIVAVWSDWRYGKTTETARSRRRLQRAEAVRNLAFRMTNTGIE